MLRETKHSVVNVIQYCQIQYLHNQEGIKFWKTCFTWMEIFICWIYITLGFEYIRFSNANTGKQPWNVQNALLPSQQFGQDNIDFYFLSTLWLTPQIISFLRKNTYLHKRFIPTLFKKIIKQSLLIVFLWNCREISDLLKRYKHKFFIFRFQRNSHNLSRKLEENLGWD